MYALYCALLNSRELCSLEWYNNINIHMKIVHSHHLLTFILLLWKISFIVVVIGLEQTRYSVPEADTLVEVCAVLMRGQLQIERIVTLTTSDITAEGLFLSVTDIKLNVE